MMSKYIKSRNYKKGKHDVVIRLNNFSSYDEKEKVTTEIKHLIHCINHKNKNGSVINYKIKIG